jgi:hypothetical protein
MKKIAYLILAALAFVSTACNFSAGAKKDFGTGLSYTHSGFTVEAVMLVGPDNTAKGDNVVPLSSTVSIVVQGLRNYELKDGKASPGLMLQVIDAAGVAVINESDLFASNVGYSAEDASVLRGTVTVGPPMKAGETYHVKMRVWDKNKIDNELNADVDIEVK